MKERVCPQCRIIMKSHTIKGYEVDVCPQCDGMFFDFEEILLAKQELDEAQNFENVQYGDDIKDHPTTSYQCPSCNMTMKEIEYEYDSGIHIDRCDSCYGIYLNKGELLQLNNYLESSVGSREAQERMKKGENILAVVEKKLGEDEKKAEKAADNLYTSDDLPMLNGIVDYLIQKII